MRIGFIGLGHMGLPMALNLCKAGYEVTGFDLNASALTAFSEQGGIPASQVQEVFLHQEVVITMVQSGAQVKQLCLGNEGLYALVSSPMLHIDCSTIDVESALVLHAQARLKYLNSLDAPVSGGTTGAKAGTLTFMAGGSEIAFKQAKPLLEAMGKKIFYTGGEGSGQAAKICNNMILGISMIAISEAFILAEHLGLSAEKLFEIVNNASGQCWAMSNYAPVPHLLPNAPATHNYQPGFKSAMMLKDLLLSQEAAKNSGMKTYLGQMATELYEQFEEKGGGELDFSAIIQLLRTQVTDVDL